ncbi:aminotransferase class I/II-fold pyridoxal phosphate-dependent enzyme [Candidatus Vidania fulgoroideorum]
MIKLDKMEFPYRVFLKKKNIFKKISLNRYPNKKEEKKLEYKIAKKFNLKKNKVSLGNGSDEIISMYISSLKRNEKVGFFYPSFSMYKKYSKLYNKKYVEIKLNKKFNFEENRIKECKIFFISYPNNPIGNIFKKKKISYIIKKYNKTLFIIDEAYFFYSKKTFLNYIKTNRNIVIIRTFSKIGFAGLRIGFLISNTYRKDEFIKVRSPYSIDKLTIKLVNKILKKKNFSKIKEKIKEIGERKKIVYNILKKKKFCILKSYANFLLIKTNFFVKKKIFDKVVIKSFIFLNKNFLRFSIGQRRETAFFLKNILKNEGRIFYKQEY